VSAGGGALTCARCGAPLPAHAAQSVATCTFCHATAAPAPRVVEQIVQRVVVVAEGVGEDGKATGSMRCPRCGGECREGRVKEAVLRGCTKCAGLWIDNGTVGRLRQHTDSDVESLARDLTRVIAMPMPLAQRTAQLSCPVCTKRLRRVEIPETPNAVDVCDEHGTWFDRDELAMFVRTFSEARAGELTEDDLQAAGLPGAAPSAGGGGFLSDVFRALGLAKQRSTRE
jgi:Zn-finger nucleic acid-binding protein